MLIFVDPYCSDQSSFHCLECETAYEGIYILFIGGIWNFDDDSGKDEML